MFVMNFADRDRLREASKNLLLTMDRLEEVNVDRLVDVNKEIMDFFNLAGNMINANSAQPHVDELIKIVDEVRRTLPKKAKRNGLVYKEGSRPCLLSAALATKTQGDESHTTALHRGAVRSAPDNHNRYEPNALTQSRLKENLIGNRCTVETAELIMDYLRGKFTSDQDIQEELAKINKFAEGIGGDAASSFFHAIRETKAVEELTDARVLATEEFVKGIGAASSFFYAIGETKAVEELTDARVLKFAEGIGGDAASSFFHAIRVTKAVEELTDARVLATEEFVKGIGRGAASSFFHAIGETKAVEELTDVRVLATEEFVKGIGGDAASSFFHAIGETKAVEELTSPAFIEWLKKKPFNTPMEVKKGKIVELAQIMSFSNSHGLCGEKWSFEHDPLIKLTGVESNDDNGLNVNLPQMAKLTRNLKAAEDRGFGRVDQSLLGKLNTTVQRTGGSITYVAFASDFINSKEAFGVLFSGSRGMIDRQIASGMSSYFGNAQSLPNTIEGWGGIEIARLVWDNKEYFKGKEHLLTGNILKQIEKGSKFKSIASLIPPFNSNYSMIYNLIDKEKTKEIGKEEMERIAADCESMIKLLFTPPKESTSIAAEFQGLVSNVGGGMKRKLNALWETYKPDENPDFVRVRDFARGLRELEKELNSLQHQDIERYSQAVYHYGKIINSVESLFAKKYFEEQLAGKSAKDPATAQEILGLLYQYIIDPDFNGVLSPGRRLLFGQCSKTIASDSKEVGSAIPSTGVLTVKSWPRNLSDIFGGRYSGDCTAPPNTGEYSGSNFDKNFGYIEDPGTSILNVYWQKSPEGKPEPVGRVYCFSIILNGKPAVLVDSIEFLASLPAGQNVENAIPHIIQDYAKHVGVPVVIDAKPHISNREWVTGAVQAAAPPRTYGMITKVGDRVYMEHTSATAFFIFQP